MPLVCPPTLQAANTHASPMPLACAPNRGQPHACHPPRQLLGGAALSSLDATRAVSVLTSYHGSYTYLLLEHTAPACRSAHAPCCVPPLRSCLSTWIQRSARCRGSVLPCASLIGLCLSRRAHRFGAAQPLIPRPVPGPLLPHDLPRRSPFTRFSSPHPTPIVLCPPARG